METINHTKIKQWIEKTIDVLEAPEENNLLSNELETIKRQTRKLERTDGLSSSEKKRVEYIKELLDNVEPEKQYKVSNNPVTVQVLTTVVIVLVIGLGVLTTLYIAKYKSANNLSYQLNTLQKQSNPDGTSKALIYTKISDFGDYSDSAQKNLQNGVSMCDVQNSLAKIDKYVPYVPNCDSTASTPSTSTKSTPSIDCTSTNFGTISSTHCQ